MKANELRIGNLIQKNGKIHYTNIFTLRDIKNLSIDDTDIFEPILITEDWLLKFGFEKVKNKDKEDLREYIGYTAQKAKYAIFDTDIFITKVDKRGLLWRSIECDFMVLFYHKSIPIKYLHQLQNLYFALTGQELTITL